MFKMVLGRLVGREGFFLPELRAVGRLTAQQAQIEGCLLSYQPPSFSRLPAVTGPTEVNKPVCYLPPPPPPPPHLGPGKVGGSVCWYTTSSHSCPLYVQTVGQLMRWGPLQTSTALEIWNGSLAAVVCALGRVGV